MLDTQLLFTYGWVGEGTKKKEGNLSGGCIYVGLVNIGQGLRVGNGIDHKSIPTDQTTDTAGY